MAGRPKKRIDYSGWSVDIFSNDTKIDKLLDAQGWEGFGVYFYLCQMAFGGEGYFYEWCYDLCATTARKMGGGVGAGTVKETVDYCLRIGLFDKGLFDRWGVLTSRGIQKSYLIVLKSKNRKGTQIYNEYWLLDKNKKEDYQGVIFVQKIKESVRANDDSPGVNDDSLGVNDDSLGQKESKGKESNLYTEIISYLNEKAGTGYRSTSKKTRSLIDARIREGFGISDFQRVIDNKVADWNHPPREGREDMRPYLRPETLFGTKFESYLNQRRAEEGEERRWRRLD